MRTLKSALNPHTLLENHSSYQGQPRALRMYQNGYGSYMDLLPVLEDKDPFLRLKIDMSVAVIKDLSIELKENGNWATYTPSPRPNLIRNVIAFEAPEVITGDNGDEFSAHGSELVVAQWKKGFTTPIHGHAAGFMHEELLSGKLLMSVYRKMGDKVRVVQSFLFTEGTITSEYTPHNPNHLSPQAVIHNFTAVDDSITLNYLPDHPQFAKQDQFEVEYFESVVGLSAADVIFINAQQSLSMKTGDVALIRSEAAREYGDHYYIVTGPAQLKPHGLRLKNEQIIAPHATVLLDAYRPYNGAIVLRLNDAARDKFHSFHGITVENNEVIFPNL